MSLRFIDAGMVSGPRSQSIYHGLGYAQQIETPNTIVLATPETPYMCIGFFQDVANELDINYCKDNNLPIIRRETGGGAVYIDSGQLFVQWIFQQDGLPRRVDKRFELFIKPLVETYKFFGIDAYFVPINDVHVQGKKIVGTGAGTIGEAQIVTGNFMFDFDYKAMIEAVNVPTKDFRMAVSKNLKSYLTNMNKELAQVPHRSEVTHVYRKKCEEVLGLKTFQGSFTDAEIRKMELTESKFIDKNWLFQTTRKPLKNKLFKIHWSLWIGYIHFDIDHETITALITMKEDVITEIKLGVDKLKTSISLQVLENNLIGTKMEKAFIREKIKLSKEILNIETWVAGIYKMKELQLQQIGHGTMARSN